MARSATLNVMVQAAQKAARGLMRDFGEVENLQVSVKGPGDFVSAADRRAEKVIYEELERARPGYSFLMEESGIVEGSDTTHRWIVDPLDGTTNFLHGIPMFSISIALERDGVLVAGIIYCPALDELFVAERGQGAFLNDRYRLRVANRNSLDISVVCCGVPHQGRGDLALFREELSRLQPLVAGIRRTGSAALDLAWLAAGRFDIFWERDLKSWDIAAGAVLVREAGGTISEIDGGDEMMQTGDVLAGNSSLHPQMVKLLRP